MSISAADDSDIEFVVSPEPAAPARRDGLDLPEGALRLSSAAYEGLDRGLAERRIACRRVRRDRPDHQATALPEGARPRRPSGTGEGRSHPGAIGGAGCRAPQPAHLGDGRPAARPLPQPVRRRPEHTDAISRLPAQPHLPLPRKISVGRLEPETLDAFYAELRRCRKHCTTSTVEFRVWLTFKNFRKRSNQPQAV